MQPTDNNNEPTPINSQAQQPNSSNPPPNGPKADKEWEKMKKNLPTSVTLPKKVKEALDAAFALAHKENPELKSFSGYLTILLAKSVGIELNPTDINTRVKYTSNEQRVAAIKLRNEKAAEQRKLGNQMIAAIKKKMKSQDRGNSIEAMTEYLKSQGYSLDDDDE